METPPNPPVFAVNEKPEHKKKSTLGCVSFAFAAISYGLIILLIILLALNKWDLATYAAGSFVAVPILLICSLIAFILGIIGVFKKNEKKGLAILGIIPFSFSILLVVFFIISLRTGNPRYLPWKDDFTDERWLTRTEQNYAITISDGVLRIRVTIPSQDVWSTLISEDDFSNIHLEVTANRIKTSMSTEMGIKCYVQDLGDSYSVKITSLGDYAIFQDFYKRQDVILTNNGEWSNSGLIKRNADSYRIGMDCGNNAITLYVDGIKIDTVYDATYKGGGVSLVVGSDSDTKETEVTFDDFEMEKLK